ncbi:MULTISPECIES: hypothetical protein [Ramlibacter]|uniref:DUF1236 domain-containing protein n=1 Tax=Ramlibacter aquaticus TaxID=2780094 RepID=A0ABR9S9I5_9BURK|nr:MULTISPECIES: hypothetical protein [Ramlibacter]MBE7939000.1 hypothetical protein [Ramlibacter aquaticus]
MSMRFGVAMLAAGLLGLAGGAQAASALHKADTQPPQQAPAPSTGVTGYGVKLGGFFNAQHKQVARKFFQRYAKGKECPEGMEREGHQCKPPVPGRYWAVGQPLQSAVATYPLPQPLREQLPAPPAGYAYLRAGDDILLVSDNPIHLVVDVMEDVVG